MGCLRRIVGVSKREHLHNTTIRKRMGGREDVLQRIAGRRIKYFGHVEKMPDSRYPYMLSIGRGTKVAHGNDH